MNLPDRLVVECSCRTCVWHSSNLIHKSHALEYYNVRQWKLLVRKCDTVSNTPLEKLFTRSREKSNATWVSLSPCYVIERWEWRVLCWVVERMGQDSYFVRLSQRALSPIVSNRQRDRLAVKTIARISHESNSCIGTFRDMYGFFTFLCFLEISIQFHVLFQSNTRTDHGKSTRKIHCKHGMSSRGDEPFKKMSASNLRCGFEFWLFLHKLTQHRNHLFLENVKQRHSRACFRDSVVRFLEKL